MRAAIYTQYGPPEVVKILDIEIPVPKDHEVRIRVRATTVNRTDCGFRSAEYVISRFFTGLLWPKNKILGCEFAGEIESIGKEVKTFRVGDKVFGFNDTTLGGHAEYLVLPEQTAITTIPPSISYAEAAAITEGAHYALCDIRAAKVKAGDHVLVYGATGAIGSAAIQLLKYYDATVTAVCGTKHVGLIKSLGADHVVDYQTEDFTKTDQRYDFIFDAVGKTSFGHCKPLLKEKGIYISTELGKHCENIFLALAGSLSRGKKVLFPIPTISKADVVLLKELVATGRYKPLIDRQYPFEQILDAYRYVETGQKTGNVILQL